MCVCVCAPLRVCTSKKCTFADTLSDYMWTCFDGIHVSSALYCKQHTCMYIGAHPKAKPTMREDCPVPAGKVVDSSSMANHDP